MDEHPHAAAERGSDDPEYAANLQRATLAASVGSALEYYDFALYSLASALIFGRIFFPALGESAATVASFATLAIGFFARPLGGLFFGGLDHEGIRGVAGGAGEGSADGEQGAAEQIRVVGPERVWNEVEGDEGDEKARARNEQAIVSSGDPPQAPTGDEHRSEHHAERRQKADGAAMPNNTIQ